MKKKIILTFVRYYLPGHKSGGPVRTISNLVDNLGDEFEFRIVTSDRDFQDTTPYQGIKLDQWNPIYKAWVYYASIPNKGFGSWIRLIRQTPHDVLYLNSLFDPSFTLYPIVANRFSGVASKPLVLAPRGEFSAGALKLKTWKKIPFLFIARLLSFYKEAIWHASTEQEMMDIQKWFGTTAKIFVARNFPTKQRNTKISFEAEELNGALRVVFLSRITRKKNLDYALKVLSRVNSVIKFDIWGTIDDTKYWDECKKLIRRMPTNIQVRYCGIAEHSKVIEVLSRYDLFFLPTRGENYCHAIAEALMAGIPILISDQSPWRNLKADSVGWDLPITNGEGLFIEAIKETIKMDMRERMVLREKIIAYAEKHLSDSSVLEANRQVFTSSMQSLSCK